MLRKLRSFYSPTYSESKHSRFAISEKRTSSHHNSARSDNQTYFTPRNASANQQP